MKIEKKNIWTIFSKRAYSDTTGLLVAVCSSQDKAKKYVKQKFPNAKKEPGSLCYFDKPDLIVIEQEEIDMVL
jgi:hypothetical protein